MPWMIAKDGDKFCVHKEAADGGAGEQVACHATEAEAKQQMAALYANEPGAKAVAVRMVEGADDLIEGPGIPFGGPFNGNDLYGEHFSAKTDFAFGWFPDGVRPLLYHHGLDATAAIAPVGRVKSHEIRADIGVWTQAQLDKSSEYFTAIKDMVKAGKLFFSSGAMAHLVDVDKRSGEIKRWPWVELSLTPSPANLLATVDFATATRHYEAAGLALPPVVTAPPVKAKLAGSYEDLIAKLDVACNPIDPVTGYQTYNCHVIATFAGHCIVQRYEETGPSTYWKIAYSLDAADMPTMSESQQMEQTYVPVKPERSMAMMAWTVAIEAADLTECTKGLIQRRLKEGRVISDANRRRIQSCMDQMGATMKEMQTLLDSTAPQPAKAAAVRRLHAQLVAQQMAAMTLN